MIFLDIELSVFCVQKRIEPGTHICSCGKILVTNIPVVTNKSFGLVTDICDCGEPKRGYTFVPKNQTTTKQIINNFNKI